MNINFLVNRKILASTFFALIPSFAWAVSGSNEVNSTGNELGVFGQVVATAGSIIAATFALLLCWKGRFNWEPVEQDIPRSAQRVGGLLIGISIGIIWYQFQRKTYTSDHLISMTIFFGVLLSIAFIGYGVLISVYVYEKLVAAGGKDVRSEKIIGGFWLTPRAKAALSPLILAEILPNGQSIPKPTTIGEYFKGVSYNIDDVWPRFSRALAKAAFQVSYIATVGGGTCALATISILLAVKN